MTEDEPAPPHVHARIAEVLRTRGLYANRIGDQLADDFFDEKIAPYLLNKGLTPDRIAYQRGVFSDMVVQARAELRSYGL